MKKIFSLIIVLLMAVNLMAGCGGSPQEQNEQTTAGMTKASDSTSQADSAVKSNEENIDGNGEAASDPTTQSYKIAVAIPQYNSQNTMFKNFYENFISEAFNVEFIFSEALNNDVAAEMQFMENAKNSGATGYISYNISTTEHSASIIAKANDLQLYTAVNANPSEDVMALEYFSGAVSSTTETGLAQISEQFTELTNILMDYGKDHNVAICTMGASNGSEQHIESTVAALKALQTLYGLTYEKNVAELAQVQSVTEISTGTDMKITLIPGIQVTEDVEQVLKGGEYDAILCVGPQYAWFESVIASVENALDMDIRTCSIVGLDEATKTSFNTEDITGNPSLNCALVKNSSVAAETFVLVYNALTGNPDVFKTDGQAGLFTNLMWVCDSAQTFDLLYQVDSSAALACFSTDEIKSVIAAIHPELTATDFESWCLGTTSDQVLGKLGLK